MTITCDVKKYLSIVVVLVLAFSPLTKRCQRPRRRKRKLRWDRWRCHCVSKKGVVTYRSSSARRVSGKSGKIWWTVSYDNFKNAAQVMDGPKFGCQTSKGISVATNATANLGIGL